MAKTANSVIGIDLGKHVFKSVLLQREGDHRFVLTNYASRTVPETIANADELAQQVKLLLKDLGGSAKSCAVAASDPNALLRIIEQPNTPVELLRSALRLNGLAVLNQECKDFVLDCAPVSAVALAGGDPEWHRLRKARARRVISSAACCARRSNKFPKRSARRRCLPTFFSSHRSVPSTPSSSPTRRVFANEAFLLLDMGHLQSTVLIGHKTELMLVRSIDYGGKLFGEALTADGAVDAEAARLLMQEGDAGMAETCRSSLLDLATEVRNSIGFFEGQCEESIHRIFVSGGMAKTEMILQTLSDELGLPCEIWDPLETCEVALPPAKRQALSSEFVSLNVACGAAISYLKAA